jgi:hypothetical protein
MRSLITFTLSQIIRMIKPQRMGWAGHAACMGEQSIAYKILVGKSVGKRPLGRPRCRWEDNMKMDHRATAWSGTDWIDLGQE